tara:strand:+ start:828 stop:1253 length:426 start_codon:yes stop_codon:yes gene_type:complete
MKQGNNLPQNPGLLPPKVHTTKNFSDVELCCSCCGENKMQESFLLKLQEIRDDFAYPMHVNSAYRCPAFNMRISKTGANGPHTTGRAIDIGVSGKDALRLVALALRHGMTGIGLSQKGDYPSRYCHIDDLTEGIRPHLWTY